jgi:hypothetical protein
MSTAMTHFRLRWQKQGAHIHVGVWSGTFGECMGTLLGMVAQHYQIGQVGMRG